MHISQRPVEYFILMEPRPDGPVVGYLDGRPIPTAVIDCWGRHYSYAGVASRRRSGQYDVDSLAPGEWIMDPGLVYRQDARKS